MGPPHDGSLGVPDPAAVEGVDSERLQAFRDAFRVLENRIKVFASLPLDTLDKINLQQRLDKIGSTADAGSGA